MADHEDVADPFAEGRIYPSTVECWPDADGPWQVTFDWLVIDGRIECKRVEITAISADLPVTPGVLRDLKIGERIRRGRAELTERVVATSVPRSGGLRRSTQSRLEEVASTYRAAFAAGQPPTKAVAERFGITRGGASSLVARAREAGLLPPTSPGAPQG